MSISTQYAKAVNEVRKKWEDAERLVVNCDPKSVYALSEVDVLLERYKQYVRGHELRILSEDQEIMKKEFAVSCVCKKKSRRK